MPSGALSALQCFPPNRLQVAIQTGRRYELPAKLQSLREVVIRTFGSVTGLGEEGIANRFDEIAALENEMTFRASDGIMLLPVLSSAMVVSAWSSAPSCVPRIGSDVHVWRIDVADWRPCVPMLCRLLAPDERARADRFRFEADAHRLIISRGVLRLLVGQLLHMLPQRVAFSYSDSGKPSIVGVHFNVAHSGELILIATHQYRIGVDVERVDRMIDVAAVGRACFTARERALIVESAATQEAFFQLWTRKEAWLKAVGSGLSFPLHHVDVANASAPVMTPDAVIDGAPPSRIIDLPAQPGYVAACAVSGPECRMRLWRVENTWSPTSAGTT